MIQEDDETRAVVEYLRAGREPGDSREDEAIRLFALERKVRDDEELEALLRSLGVNRQEREAHRRGRRTGRPAANDRHRETQRLRIGYYIDQRVDWTKETADRNEIVDGWARLADYDVDWVCEALTKGADPLLFQPVLDLIVGGIARANLFLKINGKTVLQLAQEGNSLTWIQMAFHFKRSRGIA